MRKLFFTLLLLFTGSIFYAQVTVTGTVQDAADHQPIPDVNIQVVGTTQGTVTDFDGKFQLNVNHYLPFTLKISVLGYAPKEVTVEKDGQNLNINLNAETQALDEVVLSASRTPERIRESPVTIERVGVRQIQSTTAPDFYDGLENLKGVDINTNSLTFKSINTRGFATFSNTRFMQLVDGMDNTSPALNFALGNLLGLSELDAESVEILPGASSALYGANAYNGILFMTSKNPFKHTGISMYFKPGITTQDAAGDNRVFDWGVRYAYKFNEHFAGKANFSYLNGTDWWATDYNQYTQDEIGKPNIITPYEDRGINFDGLNIYGDEIHTNIHDVAQSMVAGGLLPASALPFIPGDVVSRTGYKERYLTDYNARRIRADLALHIKPWADDKELIFQFRSGRGNTIYQGANRYYIKDFVLNQSKIEFKGDNFFIRGYRTSEDAGDSYDIRFTGINMNRLNAPQWYGTYVGAYAQGASDIYTDAIMAGASADQAMALVEDNSAALHAGARAFADQNVTPQPGTPEFDTLFNQVVTDPDLTRGSKFIDKSKVHHVDVNYNFNKLLNNAADVQIGGSYRLYTLNSEGTIFTDYDSPINYTEYGAYLQASKKLMDDRFKLTGSVRYDKGQNFDGNMSPRVALVYSAGEHKEHNFRVSYQTGFRNPTTQDQYIGLDVGQAFLVGSAPDNLDRYVSKPLDVSLNGQAVMGYTGIGSTLTLTGRAAYENAFTYTSLLAFQQAVQDEVPVVMQDYPGISVDDATALAAVRKRNVLQKAETELVRPEGIQVMEAGYRGKIGDVTVDLSGYFNQYDGFISTKTVIVPFYGNADLENQADEDLHPALVDPETGDHLPNSFLSIVNGDLQPFQVYTNSKADISSYGGAIGLGYTLWDKVHLGANYTYAKFIFDQASDPDYEAGFNTPEHKVKLSVGVENILKNLDLNVNYRWSDSFLWESSFVDAIVPQRSVVDAGLSLKVPSFKSVFKLGGANIGGPNYMPAPGTGLIGSQYYISWVINP